MHVCTPLWICYSIREHSACFLPYQRMFLIQLTCLNSLAVIKINLGLYEISFTNEWWFLSLEKKTTTKTQKQQNKTLFPFYKIIRLGSPHDTCNKLSHNDRSFQIFQSLDFLCMYLCSEREVMMKWRAKFYLQSHLSDFDVISINVSDKECRTGHTGSEQRSI